MEDLTRDVKAVFDEYQAQKQRLWNMANDLFITLQQAEKALKRSAAETEGVTLALIETTLDKYTKKGERQ